MLKIKKKESCFVLKQEMYNENVIKQNIVEKKRISF